MSRKSTLDALFGTKIGPVLGVPNTGGDALGTPNAASPTPTPPPVRTGAVAAMGASLQHWQAAQKTSEELTRQMAGAKTEVEIDPALIDPAPVRDRLSIDQDRSLDALVASIRESGQQVPVLLRPHPSLPGRFQTAYGHRRIEAARRLGSRVRAIVTELDDAALLTAQGKENSERRDLTFIEKALFARRLEDGAYDRSLICAALSADKGDLSRAIAVARAVPDRFIEAIGPAPKAGRARWLALVEALKGARGTERADALIASERFREFHSDERFAAMMAAVLPTASANLEPAGRAQTLVATANGRPIVEWRQTAKRHLLALDETLAPGFAAALVADLPELYARYLDRNARKPG